MKRYRRTLLYIRACACTCVRAEAGIGLPPKRMGN